MARPKKKIKGNYQGKRLDASMEECVHQVFLATGRKAETARRLGLCYTSVCKILKKDTVDPELDKKRRDSAVKIAGRIHGKVNDILDSINPEDLESGYTVAIDRNGIERKIAWGPSLLQKTTAGAIWVDKLEKLESYKKALEEDRVSGYLPLPTELRALVSGIQGKFKKLSMLNIHFEEENKDLSQKVQDKLAEMEIVNAATPAEAEILDFDNPETYEPDTCA